MVTLGQQLLKLLVAKLGGPDQAAVGLGITDTLMRHMLSGTLPVPDSVLLKAVDLVGSKQDLAPPNDQKPASPRGPAT